MTAPPPPSAPAALPAFLRGVERRAAVLAELQCGDAMAGDAAVAAAMRAFRAGAGRLPLAQWPLRFWTLLLAAPQLRRTPPAPAANQGADGDALAALGNGMRVALLLRLVAGLDAPTAAAALAVAPARYQQALADALSRHGGDGLEALQRLEDALQQRLRQLPGPRLMQLAQMRERALLGTPEPAPGRTTERPARNPRWLLPLRIGVGVCAAALVATFLWPALLSSGFGARLRGGANAPTRSEALPPAEAPAARFDADFAAIAHRDFVLLADPEGLRQAQALPLLAWYAAELAAAATIAAPLQLVDAVAGGAPLPLASAPSGAALSAAGLPTALDAQLQRLPASLRAQVRPQAAAWSDWDDARRGAWLERQARWDALPAAERGAGREAYAAWRGLSAADRAEVQAAGMALALLPAPEQQVVQQRFAALDRSSQRGWLLGPVLGGDYPKLQPLLAQLPEDQHAPLLATLRAMDAGERADLAVLAQRVPPQERAALRRALLSTSAENRSAWLRLRLEQ